MGEQLGACAVEFHSNTIDTAGHGVIQAFFQGRLVDVMLVLTNSNGFGIQLYQL